MMGRWLAGTVVAATLGWGAAAHPLSHPQVAEIYGGMETVLGQTIELPKTEQTLRGAIVTLQPGEETPWHTHEVPLFFYVLEGTLTVDYGPQGLRSYGAGTSALEAVGIAHKGRNDGTEPMRVLAVYILGDGKPAASPAEAPPE